MRSATAGPSSKCTLRRRFPAPASTAAWASRLVDDANRGAFDVILLEHIDRLSRNAADTIRLREQMDFIGIDIHTCASGLVTESMPASKA
jgi:hypothetical protein